MVKIETQESYLSENDGGAIEKIQVGLRTAAQRLT
jgi:hypothetical protein